MRKKPNIGILALSLELYETLAPGLRENRQQWLESAILPQLREKMDVCFEEAVYTREGIERVVEAYEHKGVDGIVVICLTYSPSELALPVLSKTPLPIMIWNTQELWSVDSGFTSEQMTNNHGVHGTQDLCSVLCRYGVKFQYATSHLNDDNALMEVVDFAAAASAVRKLRSANVGQLGGAFPSMGDFAVDSTFLAASLGSRVVRLSLGELFQMIRAVSAKAVAETVNDYKTAYAVSPDITPDELEQSARMEIALRTLAEKEKLSALTYLFSAFGEDSQSPTLPFVAASRWMADGVGFGGEGDVVGALGSFFLNALHGPATFSEMFTIDFGGGSLFMSHMGEANVSMADGSVEMIARPAPITKTLSRQLALRFSLVPGESTFFSLVQAGNGNWRMIASVMDIAKWSPVADIPCPQFKLSPRIDVRGWLTAYAQAGGPHHNALCFGDACNRLRMAAEMLNAEYVEI